MNALLIALSVVGAFAILSLVIWTLVVIYTAWHENLVLDAVDAVRKDLASRGLLEKTAYGYRRPTRADYSKPGWDDYEIVNRRVDALEAKNAKKKGDKK